MYGSSNLTLKKKEAPGLYGGMVRSTCFFPLLDVGGPGCSPSLLDAGDPAMCERTTNPSTGSPSHSPVTAQDLVKSLTSLMVLRVMVGVLMKPHSSAKASTRSVVSVLNSLQRTLRPCK